MTVTLTARAVRPGPGRSPHPRTARPAIVALPLAIGLSVLLLGLAVTASRANAYRLGVGLFFIAVLVPFVAGAAVLLRHELPRRLRQWVVVLVGVMPTLLYRLTDPLLLTGFDEQLHLRTLADLLRGAPLFTANPLLPASPHFPGLELLTVGIERATGMPTMVAITVVVLLCRVVLVLALFELGRLVTGADRAASIVVLCYAASPQFYFFNSQYAYQTLALSLAVAGFMLVARATRARTARRGLAGAALVCFAGVAVTHHLTSWITVAALAGWALSAARPQRRLIAAVAASTAAIVAVAAIPIAGLLQGYFGPMFGAAVADATTMFGGDGQRTLFADSAGTGTAAWERVLLVGYAVVCTAIAVGTGVAILRRALPVRTRLLVVLGLLCLAYPVTFAGRLATDVAEICDRATTFAFLPLALGIAWVLGRRGAAEPGHPPRRPAASARSATLLALLSVGFLGGLILGSGPDWRRLPGDYLVVADSRSLDAETLAAVTWSRDNLAPGSTVMADRVPATLLASTGRLWPAVAPGDVVQPATLYFSQTWGDEQARTVRAMRLRYLYVDSRLANGASHQTWYFYPGETPDRRRLTIEGLTKFASVPGIVTVYRHGPVAIYDLAELQDATPVHGWVGRWHRHPWRDAALGLLAGLALAALRRPLGRHASRFVGMLGGPATSAVLMASAVLLTGVATAAGFRPGWTFTAGLVLPLGTATVLRRPGKTRARRRPRLDRGVIAAALIGVVLGASGLALAVRSAWSADVTHVGEIVAAVTGQPR
jgi:hypothetical protein